MSAERDISLSEKRVYDERRGADPAYVASDMGVTRVTVAGDQVGRFSLARRCGARDLAGGGGRLVVATDADVLVGTGDAEFAETGFGPAVAVGLDGEVPVAAGPEGHLARLRGEDWAAVGSCEAAVRAIDGDLVAAADGLYHVGPPGGGLEHAGLDEVRDVAATGPWAATAAGLFHRRDGWEAVLEGAFTVVAADEGRTHAVSGDLWRREGETWRRPDPPVEAAVVDVAYGERPYLVTENGTFLVEGEDGAWGRRALGLAGVCALAVP